MSDNTQHFSDAAERTLWTAEDAERFPDDDEVSEANDEEFDDEDDEDELDEDESEEADLEEE